MSYKEKSLKMCQHFPTEGYGRNPIAGALPARYPTYLER